MSTVAPLQNNAAKSPLVSKSSHARLMLQRKCACGSPKCSLSGECEECKGKTRLQAKLSIGASNDSLEQEADRVADQVLAAPAHSIVSGAVASIQRFTGQSTGDAGIAPPSVDRVLASSGRPLDAAIQQDMGQRFGHDFSQVRVHTGSAAEQSAQDVNAHAYTVGHNIVFGAGRFAPGSHEGRKLIAHELTHVVQQNQVRSPAPVSFSPVFYPSEVKARQFDSLAGGYSEIANALSSTPTITAVGHRVQRDACMPLHPERCTLYEQWIQSFRTLSTFEAVDTVPRSTGYRYPVIGDRPAQPGEEVWSGRRASDTGRFIDQPTDAWVRANLPPELRRVAFLLPCDCADMALVLRHVWLFYHGRSERYRNWVVGAGAAQLIAHEIGREVFSGSIARMVQPYANDDGTPIRSFEQLQYLLRPGDVILVEHFRREDNRRVGDHTYIVQTVTHRNGPVTELTLLQGNQPLMEEQARAIAPGDEHRISALRSAPGRRIERITLGSNALHDQGGVWTWGASAALVYNQVMVAGPPAAARRPHARGSGHQRRSSDWISAVRGAGLQTIQGVVEATLLELRARAAGAGIVSSEEAETLGRVMGERVRSLGNRELERRIRRMIYTFVQLPGSNWELLVQGGTEDHWRTVRMMVGALFLVLGMTFDEYVVPASRISGVGRD